MRQNTTKWIFLLGFLSFFLLNCCSPDISLDESPDTTQTPGQPRKAQDQNRPNTCREGQILDRNDTCVDKKTCPVGQILDETNNCVPKECQAGQVVDAHGQCISRTDFTQSKLSRVYSQIDTDTLTTEKEALKQLIRDITLNDIPSFEKNAEVILNGGKSGAGGLLETLGREPLSLGRYGDIHDKKFVRDFDKKLKDPEFMRGVKDHCIDDAETFDADQCIDHIKPLLEKIKEL